jgi:uncharacterized lipoprotein YajG
MPPKSLIPILLIVVILLAGCATSDRTATMADTNQTDSLSTDVNKDKEIGAAVFIFLLMILVIIKIQRT